MPQDVAGPCGDGAVVAIVGGSGGVGFATARKLLESGNVKVILLARDIERGRQAAAMLGDDAFFFPVDGSDPASALTAVACIEADHGRLDYLIVATAADTLPSIFVDLSPDDVGRTLMQLALPPLITTSAALPLLRKSGGGGIVLVASDAAKVATPGETVIGAAMAAIVSFSRTLAMEVKRDGIRVNAVTPSLIEGTALTRRLMDDPFSARLFGKARKAADLGVPTAEDVANAIVFLCSASATRITGQVISVNGGISAA